MTNKASQARTEAKVLDELLESETHRFSVNAQGKVIYCGWQIPDSTLPLLNPGAYQNMLAEVIVQAERLKRATSAQACSA